MVGRHPFGDYQRPVQSAQLLDAFGERIYDEESTALSDPIGYKGQWGCYTDPELPLQYQLVYCHNRYYSPYLGRWISRDPAGADGGLNAYEFCGNNPIMNSDPSGLFFTTAPRENDAPSYLATMSDPKPGTLAMGWKNFCQGISDWGQDIWYYWHGQDLTDLNGNPIRLGGYTGLLNIHGNAQTVNGTIHVPDYGTWEDYLNDPHWQDHEEGHLVQNDRGPATAFLLVCAEQYAIGATEQMWEPKSKAGPWGHDYSGLERDAEMYAYIKEGQHRWDWQFAGEPDLP